MAGRFQGGGDLARVLLAALLHDPEGAASELAARAGLVAGTWGHDIGLPVVSEVSGLRIHDMSGRIQSIVRQAGILFRESLQEGELTSPYLFLALLRDHPELAEEMRSHGLVLERVEQALMPLAGRTVIVPGIDLDNPSIESAPTDHPALRLARARLYFLATAKACALGMERTVKEAIAGGVGVIQSREKLMPDKAWLGLLESLRRWTEDAGVLLVINDRPDLAVISGADGVHLGQDDMGVHQARGIIGQGKLVGTSTHSPTQWGEVLRNGADYAGVGPVFPSRTKEFRDLAGLGYVRDVSMTNEIPWFALGGIDLANIGQVAEAGARRVAVSSCLAASPDPRGVAGRIISALGA